MKLVVPEKGGNKVKKVYTDKTAPCNVPLRVVKVSRPQEYVKVGQIIVIVKTGMNDRYIIGHNVSGIGLHSPSYDIDVELADEIKKLELVF